VGALPTVLVVNGICRSHVPGLGQPESPQRYDAVLAALQKAPYFPRLRQLHSRAATAEEVLACHEQSYVLKAQSEIQSGAQKLSTGDTYVCAESLKAAYCSAGAACVGVDAVLGGQAKNAFCLIRPPGHHATKQRGMGFCIFNNAAIAARYAQQRHQLGRVLIIDWDVHHGNGTQDIFYEDDTVFYFSTHQAAWYPWTGAADETGQGKGRGYTLNCPLPRGAGRNEFLAAFQGQLGPAVNRFKPELILISAGFDARIGDPLGRLALTDEDYVELTGLVMEMARQHCGGRLVSLLEGGYNLTGLASAVTAHCGRLAQG
jgi:acetoin utilization deacetylase AcuC-like enzyme